MACMGYRNGCTCHRCQKRAVREVFYDKPSPAPASGWSPASSQPPQVGFVRNAGEGDDCEVSFKQGQGSREGHTLIADGNMEEDSKGFDARHNHYGPKAEDEGHFSEDRGHYTGPGH